MKFLPFCLKLVCICLGCAASSYAGTSHTYVVAFDGQSEVAVVLQQKADYGQAGACARCLCRSRVDSSVSGFIGSTRQERLFAGANAFSCEGPRALSNIIVELIAEDVKGLRSVFGENAEVSLNGLAGPVRVRQLDDRRVELFIDYTMQVDF